MLENIVVNVTHHISSFSFLRSSDTKKFKLVKVVCSGSREVMFAAFDHKTNISLSFAI